MTRETFETRRQALRRRFQAPPEPEGYAEAVAKVAVVSREEERRKVAKAFFPFLIDSVKAGKKLHLTYDREQLILALEAFRYDLMKEVEAREDLPDELKMEFANAVSGLSKFWSGIVAEIDRGGGESFFAVLLAMRRKIDKVCDFLGIEENGKPYVDAEFVEVKPE